MIHSYLLNVIAKQQQYSVTTARDLAGCFHFVAMTQEKDESADI